MLILILAVGCQRKLTTSLSEAAKDSVPHAKLTPVSMPDDSTHTVFMNLRFAQNLFQVYHKREFKPIWIDKNSLTENADSMLQVIASARRYGLLPQHYHAREIANLVIDPDTKKMQRLDAVLLDAFFWDGKGSEKRAIVFDDAREIR